MYKLLLNDITNVIGSVQRLADNAYIPFAPANTDYMAFKQALTTGTNLDGTPVQLQDATGTVMTADQIKTFMETLP
jgi:hypothetical protein